MSEKRLFGLVCQTALQGLTISLGDIYLTRESAEAEHADMRRMRAEGDDDGEDDDGFAVVEIIVKGDGSITDTFDAKITVTDAENPQAVIEAVTNLYKDRPLSDLQKLVLENYADGDFSHLETIGETRGSECGDTLVQFLMAEAADAGGDPEQLATQLNSAIRQLQELQSALVEHAVNNPRPRG
jgi:hypothetical protein